MEVDKYLDREKLKSVTTARPFVQISDHQKLQFANAALDFMAPIFNEGQSATRTEVEQLKGAVAELLLEVSNIEANSDDFSRRIEKAVGQEIDRKTSEFITEDELKDTVASILEDAEVNITL